MSTRWDVHSQYGSITSLDKNPLFALHSFLLQEQIFKMVLRGHIDFKTEPWPNLSAAAKDCVKRLLEQVGGEKVMHSCVLGQMRS